jgi:hypothetical protein
VELSGPGTPESDHCIRVLKSGADERTDRLWCPESELIELGTMNMKNDRNTECFRRPHHQELANEAPVRRHVDVSDMGPLDYQLPYELAKA